MVIKTLYHSKISSVNVDSIVHHALIESIYRFNLALAAREVCCVGLSGKVTVCTLLKRHAETVESDILAHLREKTHTLGIIDITVLQQCILVK